MNCIDKQNHVVQLFEQAQDPESKYHLIIALGKKLPKLAAVDKVSDNLVQGCQSTMYLKSVLENGLVFFSAESDALISAGLAAILVDVYSGETPETILTVPPKYLELLGVSATLTPNRANGLYSIHLKMKQEALKYLLAKNK